MDIQHLYRVCYHLAFLTGLAGGCFAHRARPSGKRALALALAPLVLVLARGAGITVARWSGVSGISDLFC